MNTKNDVKESIAINEMTPGQIVAALDKYVIGHSQAKRAVSIALRNRYRRMKLSQELQKEVMPKNIILIGPTGVGKTEIARRLATLSRAPFIKVEATKYTEVGYVGRDVESMIRDLVKVAMNMIRQEKMVELHDKVEENVEERILDILLPPPSKRKPLPAEDSESFDKTRAHFKKKLQEKKLEDRVIEVEMRTSQMPSVQVVASPGIEDLDMYMQDMLSGMIPKASSRKKTKISSARGILFNEELQKLIDMEEISREAIERVENHGVVFIDEIDKIVGGGGHGPDVSREGVQRDILPIVEGATVNTRFGIVNTQHILFIAAGAFHHVKPSDLIPELQGRFPVKVELDKLTEEDFARILTEPEHALIKQYKALLMTDGVEIEVEQGAISAIASIAVEVNKKAEDIGARRLHTVLEKLFEDIAFSAPDNITESKVIINKDTVMKKLKIEEIIKGENMRKKTVPGFGTRI